jgi:hypothetical protein
MRLLASARWVMVRGDRSAIIGGAFQQRTDGGLCFGGGLLHNQGRTRARAELLLEQ